MAYLNHYKRNFTEHLVVQLAFGFAHIRLFYNSAVNLHAVEWHML